MTDPGAGGLRVYALGHRLLDALRMAALDLGVTLPDKQIVTSGEAAHDCEMVAVTFINLITGIPGAAQGAGFSGSGCYPAWSAVMRVEIVRCAPLWPEDNNGVVAAPVINDALMPVSRDTEVIMGSVSNLSASEFNFGDIMATIQYRPPTGGFTVTVGQLTATLA